MKKYVLILFIVFALLTGWLIWCWYERQLNKLDRKIQEEESSIIR